MRILISACLLGARCRYDGVSKLQPWISDLAGAAHPGPRLSGAAGGLPTPSAGGAAGRPGDDPGRWRCHRPIPPGRGRGLASLPPAGMRGGAAERAESLLRQRDGLRRHLYRRADGGRGCHGGAAACPGHSGVRRVPGGGVGGPHLNRPDSHGRRSARRTGRRRSFPPRHGLQPGENVVDSKP